MRNYGSWICAVLKTNSVLRSCLVLRRTVVFADLLKTAKTKGGFLWQRSVQRVAVCSKAKSVCWASGHHFFWPPLARKQSNKHQKLIFFCDSSVFDVFYSICFWKKVHNYDCACILLLKTFVRERSYTSCRNKEDKTKSLLCTTLEFEEKGFPFCRS